MILEMIRVSFFFCKNFYFLKFSSVSAIHFTSIGAASLFAQAVFLPRQVAGSPSPELWFYLAACSCGLLGHVQVRLVNIQAMANGLLIWC